MPGSTAHRRPSTLSPIQGARAPTGQSDDIASTCEAERPLLPLCAHRRVRTKWQQHYHRGAGVALHV